MSEDACQAADPQTTSNSQTGSEAIDCLLIPWFCHGIHREIGPIATHPGQYDDGSQLLQNLSDYWKWAEDQQSGKYLQTFAIPGTLCKVAIA
jgi:hypothetical protein